MTASIETVSQHKTHGGTLGYYRHASDSCRCDMRFTVFTPPQAADGPVPVVFWLSGLTCTEDNFTTKAGAYGVAAELGLMVVAPDTSPRGADRDGTDVPDDEAYDLGQGAGFYLDATEAPWNTHFNMYSYIAGELPALIDAHFPADPAKRSIMGHSMGGHGALTIWLKNTDMFASASGIAPICAPMHCAWGEKVLNAYLGPDRAAWEDYDATALVTAQPIAPKSSSTRASPTSFSTSSIPPCSRMPAPPPARNSPCAARTATITAISSSRPSSATICAITQRRWPHCDHCPRPAKKGCAY